mmetsp:Transcript_7823/g.11610  ORF Transcript_7823/g.11610 Transcript_7823/m.11610 type:complete len:563 (+) Transcript_7823:67-1755(+)
MGNIISTEQNNSINVKNFLNPRKREFFLLTALLAISTTTIYALAPKSSTTNEAKNDDETPKGGDEASTSDEPKKPVGKSEDDDEPVVEKENKNDETKTATTPGKKVQLKKVNLTLTLPNGMKVSENETMMGQTTIIVEDPEEPQVQRVITSEKSPIPTPQEYGNIVMQQMTQTLQTLPFVNEQKSMTIDGHPAGALLLKYRKNNMVFTVKTYSIKHIDRFVNVLHQQEGDVKDFSKTEAIVKSIKLQSVTENGVMKVQLKNGLQFHLPTSQMRLIRESSLKSDQVCHAIRKSGSGPTEQQLTITKLEGDARSQVEASDFSGLEDDKTTYFKNNNILGFVTFDAENNRSFRFEYNVLDKIFKSDSTFYSDAFKRMAKSVVFGKEQSDIVMSYRHLEDKFSFKLPENALVEEAANSCHVIHKEKSVESDDEGPVLNPFEHIMKMVETSIQKREFQQPVPDIQTLEKMHSQVSSQEVSIIESKIMTVNGIKLIRQIQTALVPMGGIEIGIMSSIVWVNNNNCYQISSQCHNDKFDDYTNEFESIHNSFVLDVLKKDDGKDEEEEA